MTTTPILGLPHIAPGQAQKHVTYNEAIEILDRIVQLATSTRTAATPPGSPLEGARCIVAPSGVGAWSGHDGDVAVWRDGQWTFHVPQPGWTAFVLDEGMLVSFDGAAWIPATSINPVSHVGVNTTADDTNRLAVAADASLFTHAGADHRIKINKAAGGDTASVLYQTGFSGRAEIGLTGDDELHVKVSADGAAWRDTLRCPADGGVVIGETATDADAQASFERANGVIYWERAAASSLNGVNWRHIVQGGTFVGSGPGGATYSNEGMALGWNLGSLVGTPATSGTPAVWDAWEYKYNIGGKYGHERHMEMIDTSGALHRFFSFAVPHDGTTGSSHLLAIDAATWTDFAGNIRISWDLIGNAAYFGSTSTAFVVNFAKNNAVVMQQRNAANSGYIALPYIDNANQLVLTGPVQQNSGAVTSSQPGYAAYWNTNTIGHGSKLFAMIGGSQTNADITIFFGEVSTPWRAQKILRNYHASGYSEQIVAAGGPAFSHWSNGSYGNGWRAGRNSSDHFFIGQGDPGTNTALTIDKTSLAVTFAKAPKLPTFTIAALPSVSTYGAGSMIYVSDESGGAVMCFSDGSNWRRVTDRAVAS